MTKALRKAIKVVFVCAAVTMNSGLLLAQSGSAGGSIGNDDKSLSGSRPKPRAVEPGKTEEPSRAPPRISGGSTAGSFDGAWVVVGVGTTCSGGSTTAVVVTSGRIIGQGSSGSVSPGGAVNAVGNSRGITIISTGRLAGRHGSGSFRQSDGCSGRWSASKQ